jgi:rubrerythrin
MQDLRPSVPTANDNLYALIELGYDATAAYTAAIRCTKNLNLRCMLDQFRSDHMRHTHVLGRQLRMLGTEPPSGFDIRPILAHGPKAIRELNSDREVLEAMVDVEGETFCAYSEALLDSRISAHVRATIRQNLDDEYRHGSWIRAELAALKSAELAKEAEANETGGVAFESTPELVAIRHVGPTCKQAPCPAACR